MARPADYRTFLNELLQHGLEFFGLYYADYLAEVKSNEDPKKKGRLLIVCPDVHGKDSQPKFWAEPSFPLSARRVGWVHIPPKGSWVWVRFRGGKPEFPRWVAGAVGYAPGDSDLPLVFSGRGSEDPAWQSPKGTDTGTLCNGGTMTEPTIQREGKYPYNGGFISPYGKYVVELDETPGKERFHVFDRNSTSWFELDRTGQAVFSLAKGIYGIVGDVLNLHLKKGLKIASDMLADVRIVGNSKVELVGNPAVKVIGNPTFTVVGNATSTVSGNMASTVQGNSTSIVEGQAFIQGAGGGPCTIKVPANSTLESSGDLNIKTPGGTLNVNPP